MNARDDNLRWVPLTRREREILQGVADGLSNAEIAAQLFLSAGTVKWHLNNVYAKLGVHKRTAAVARARRLGLLREETLNIIRITSSAPRYRHFEKRVTRAG